MPFERISLINFFSLVLLRGGGGGRAFLHVNFCPRGQAFATFLCLGSGGILTAGIVTDTLRERSICESSRNCYPLLALRYLN